MSLTVAVQMDPLEKINISGDSTFAIMLGAQRRGHKLYHYLADALTWQDGRLYAGAHEVSVQAVHGDHYRLGEFTILDLGSDADVVLMRQDPPFDLGYITATHLLERIQGETLVVNDPAGATNNDVRQVYGRRSFENVWLRTRRLDKQGEETSAPGGIAYLYWADEATPEQRAALATAAAIRAGKE